MPSLTDINVTISTPVKEMIDTNTAPDGKEYPFGMITNVHVAGPYAVIQYDASRPSNAKDDWEPHEGYSGYYADELGRWRDTSHSHSSLEEALIHIICFVRELRHRGMNAALNHRYTTYIMRMTGPDEKEDY